MRDKAEAYPLARNLDDRRRLVMPEDVPPHASVTIQAVGEDAWLVQLHRPRRGLKMVLIPAVEKLPHDPKWESVEAALAKRACAKLPSPE